MSYKRNQSSKISDFDIEQTLKDSSLKTSYEVVNRTATFVSDPEIKEAGIKKSA